MDVLLELNSKQLDAVTHIDGSMLVLAGAGSGKTKVLTTRIAWLIKNNYVSPHEVLAVTFTNKAAREMVSRTANLLNADHKSLWVGTFHSISLKLLTRHHHIVGLSPHFQILDINDQLNLIKRLLKEANLTEEKYNPKDLQRFINSHKENGLRAKDVQVIGLRQQKCLEIYHDYEKVCNNEALVDFTELLLRSYELLSNNAEILSMYRKQFKHILIDEFQDTNYLQYKWLNLIAKNQDAKIFAVGDDDQSIYSFRGALASNLKKFLLDYKVEEPICLEQNYRSTPNILKAANAIINNNKDRIGKDLWTENKSTDKIFWYEGYTEEDEAYFVIDEIQKLVVAGIKLSDIAILYRSNAQSRPFEHILYTKVIPYKVYGGLRFFDRQEVKYMLAYLRLILNPHDNEALLKVVNFPPRGIGAKTINSLSEIAKERNVSLYTACSFISGKAQLNLLNFVELIKKLTLESSTLCLPELINYVIKASGLAEYYQNDKKGAGLERLENLNELINSVDDITNNGGVTTLNEFLAHTVLESGDTGNRDSYSAVQLMTVHAAKGLEFKVIFLVGLEDGLFPHENCLHSEDDIEEERRLMYVAITRAKEKLYLLRACSRMLWGKRLLAPASRFIYEIPSELIINISGLSKIGHSNLVEFDNNAIINNGIKELTDVESKTSRVELASQNLVLKIGDMIKHEKFGNGKVLRLNIDGKKIVADIFFVGLGKKTLDLNIARVEKI